MDYTSSTNFVTDVSTGKRMHLASQVTPTVVSDADCNGPIWEIMSVIEAAGLLPKAFNKADPASYTQLRQAIMALAGAEVVRPSFTTEQTMAASTETVITSTPSIVDCDLFAYSNGDYVIKKAGLYQLGMHVGYTVSMAGYWLDFIQYIKCYKANVTPTNANAFAYAGGWQPIGGYTGFASPQPRTLYNRLSTRLDVGDKVRFLHWLSQVACTLKVEGASSTQSSYTEFLYLGA